jgi:hypothetical protein
MNKKTQISTIIFLTALQLVIMLSPARLFAATAPNTSANDAMNFLNDTAVKAGLTTEAEKGARGETKTLEMIGKIINIVFGLIGILFLFQMIVAGIRWMMAAGNEETVKQSRQTIQNAVIGIAVVFSAFVITNFVLNQIADITGTSTATETSESDAGAGGGGGSVGCCFTPPEGLTKNYSMVNNEATCTLQGGAVVSSATECK